ncbi:MAG: PHP domain-containing protein [Myxococcales bacterium]|nr:PHP domain-containing protein [Myxococcales bacterium]
MRIDLHCHSTHSDGTLPASGVAQRAKERGVEVFCLSDHDTSAGYEATREVFPNAVRGVELSCSEDDRTVHLLLYALPGSDWSIVESALSLQREVRRKRVYTIAERLAEHGAVFDPEVVLERHKGAIGRPHVAAELVRTGVVASRDEAFSRLLKDGGLGDVKVNRLSVGDGVELAVSAGARVGLAHPHLQGNRAEPLIQRYREAGLSGLEVHYAIYPTKKRKAWAQVARRHNMVATAGSDFHGINVNSVTQLGVDVPDEDARGLLDWLEIDQISDA